MRFSVVIPTYQRRSIVVRTVRAFEAQKGGDFEVVVVVDGSTDGTAQALRDLREPFPLTVIEQPNGGRAAAVNAGAAAATGELLLFLDDDMHVAPDLLSEHERSRRAGADIVLGHVPLDPNSPPSEIAELTGGWAERRRKRLAAPGAVPAVSDFLSGQLSISRAAFERLGGFDTEFTSDGRFGGEDLDFGHRASSAGLSIVFNEHAVSYQYYAVDAVEYTRRSRDVGRSDQELAIRYPELRSITRRRTFASPRMQLTLGTLASLPAALSWPLRRLAIGLFSERRGGDRGRRLFFAVQTMEYTRGRRDASRRLRDTGVAVLAYHAIADLQGDEVLSEYGVPPSRFALHLESLASHGWRFVSLDRVLGALAGGERPPARALLVTFDDAYVDLLDSAYPILARNGVPAVVFAVGDLIGATNEWDRPLGARALPLLDADGLRQLAAHGVTIGAHGATHRPLVNVDSAELGRETEGVADTLEAIGLPRPTVFAHPHGEWNDTVVAAVHAAGYQAAFAVNAGIAGRAEHRYALPRIEVFAGDTPRTLRLKLLCARLPQPLRRRLFERLPGPRPRGRR
jgi:GT2 family glycosyltransferase/peptidoglycan/xylan/chitin deacetylase (PgdA/CDA1 family)